VNVSHWTRAAVMAANEKIVELSASPEHPLQGIIGMTNKPGMRVTNGGATGAYAMLAAYTWVASGLYDTVLVLGVERATDCFDFESMTETPEVIQGPPPELGQNTEEILLEAGYDWDEINALRDEGVV